MHRIPVSMERVVTVPSEGLIGWIQCSYTTPAFLYACFPVRRYASKFVKVFMAVQHEYPFQVLLANPKSFQCIWDGAWFISHLSSKVKVCPHQAVRLGDYLSCLQRTLPSHVFRHKGRVILLHISRVRSLRAVNQSYFIVVLYFYGLANRDRRLS